MSMPRILDADEEVRHRAEYLSTIIPVEQQQQTYKLLQPLIEAIRSPSPLSRGLRTSLTPPLFSTAQTVFGVPEDTLHSSPVQNYIDTMPSLNSSDGDLDSYDLHFARQTLDLPPNSAREHSPTTEPTSLECTPAAGVQLSVEGEQDFDDDIEDDGDIKAEFDRILWDAKDNFRGMKPEFVITDTRKGTSKMVDLGDDQMGEMTREAWDESKCQGYWVLNDNYGHKHIVKFFSKGKCYKEWLGTEEGFDDEPIAWPEKSSNYQRSSTSTVQDDVGDFEANESSDDDSKIQKVPVESGHGLRKRTWSQKNPYKADKKIHAAAQKGKVKRVSDIDAEEEQPRKPAKRAKKSNSKKTTQPRRSCSLTNMFDHSTLDTETFKAHITAKTTLKTVLQNDEPIPIFLSKCPDVTTMWDKIIDAWQPDIDGIEGAVKSMSIRFPWLGPKYNIKLRAGLEGSYEKMIEEIQNAPCWKDGTNKCTVDVVLVVA